MSFEEAELKVNGVSFKGVWIAIVLGIGSTIGGGVWTASSLYGRLTAVEAIQIPSIKPVEERVGLIEKELLNNDVSKLQGKLATIGTNLKTIMVQQDQLLDLKSEVAGLSKDIESMRSTVKTAEIITAGVDELDKRVKIATREIEDLWQGLDYVSNPLGK
jgi:uncharacterized small protein (DUF1192 family)